MNRISDISSAEDFELEAEREALRDRRWRRRRGMIGAAVGWSAIIALVVHAPAAVPALLKLL